MECIRNITNRIRWFYEDHRKGCNTLAVTATIIAGLYLFYNFKPENDEIEETNKDDEVDYD